MNALNWKKSIILLNIGQTKYELGKYAEAIEDFKEITSPELNAEKHTNLGLCYYQMGLFEEAEKEYMDAIRSNANIVESYYNLAVLFNDENKREQSLKLLNNCIRINRGFQDARDAIKKLHESERSDWYEWWFKKEKVRSLLGGLLLFTISSFVLLISFLSLNIYKITVFSIFGTGTVNLIEGKSADQASMTGLGIVLGLLIIVLILPNLSKIKFVGIELEATTPTAKRIIKLIPRLARVPGTLLYDKYSL
jgi:tetratricopeptide (TPR) repeat protein